MMKGVFAILAAAGCAAAASAAITPVASPFAGTLQEDYESFSTYYYTGSPISIMGGFATQNTSTYAGVPDGGWGHAHGTCHPFDGQQFATEHGFPGTTTFTFSSPVAQFGGYFDNFYSPSDVSGFGSHLDFRFYDSGGGLLGSDSKSSDADGVLDWYGWASSTGADIARVEMDNYQAHWDSLRIDDVPAPSSLALLGLGGLAAARRRRA